MDGAIGLNNEKKMPTSTVAWSENIENSYEIYVRLNQSSVAECHKVNWVVCD